MNTPAIIATSGGASRPTVDRYDNGGARITAPGNTCRVPKHLIEPLRLALLELNTRPRLPDEDKAEPVCDGLWINVCNDGVVAIFAPNEQMVAIETDDLERVARGLAEIESDPFFGLDECISDRSV